jgi:hypothetical protein
MKLGFWDLGWDDSPNQRPLKNNPHHEKLLASSTFLRAILTAPKNHKKCRTIFLLKGHKIAQMAVGHPSSYRMEMEVI